MQGGTLAFLKEDFYTRYLPCKISKNFLSEYNPPLKKMANFSDLGGGYSDFYGNKEESLDYSKDLNDSNLSIMNDNSDNDSDNIDNDELNDYDYNLLKLYEEVTKSMDNLNIEN